MPTFWPRVKFFWESRHLDWRNKALFKKQSRVQINSNSNVHFFSRRSLVPLLEWTHPRYATKAHWAWLVPPTSQWRNSFLQVKNPRYTWVHRAWPGSNRSPAAQLAAIFKNKWNILYIYMSSYIIYCIQVPVIYSYSIYIQYSIYIIMYVTPISYSREVDLCGGNPLDQSS